MPKLRKTTKLHYGKYLYKATFFNTLSFCFASFRNSKSDKLSSVKNVICNLQEQYDYNKSMTVEIWRTKKSITVSDFLETKQILNLLENSSDWRLRVEMGRYLTVYTSDETLIDNLSKDCGASEIYKPEEGMENFLLLNIDTAIVNKPIEYEYRVYLKGNKIDPNFANWFEANRDKSRIGEWTLRNIQSGYYTSGNYFYIKNDKVLTMIRMIAGHNIRRVEKLIYKGDIDKYKYGNDE